MQTAKDILEEIYSLPLHERERVMYYIIMHGIGISPEDLPEPLDIKKWQREIAERPFNFNMKEASEYLGVSTVTLRRWVKAGKVSVYKVGRAYTFDVILCLHKPQHII